MIGCRAALLLLLLFSSAYSAPTRLSAGVSSRLDPGLSPRQVTRLASLVTAETRGLEVPRDLIAGIGAGSGAMQLVINVHTDSSGNIEVYTN